MVGELGCPRNLAATHEDSLEPCLRVGDALGDTGGAQAILGYPGA
jgi:hypothetical protein